MAGERALGIGVDAKVTGWPGRIRSSCVSLKLATIQISSGTNIVRAVPGWANSPGAAVRLTMRPGSAARIVA